MPISSSQEFFVQGDLALLSVVNRPESASVFAYHASLGVQLGHPESWTVARPRAPTKASETQLLSVHLGKRLRENSFLRSDTWQPAATVSHAPQKHNNKKREIEKGIFRLVLPKKEREIPQYPCSGATIYSWRETNTVLVEEAETQDPLRPPACSIAF